MFDAADPSRRLDFDGDKVNPPGSVRRTSSLKVVLSGMPEPLLLAASDGLLGPDKPAYAPRADLDEHQLAVIFRDDVYLATRAAVVAREQAETGALQPASRELLAGGSYGAHVARQRPHWALTGP
jgi:hypothetical protein